MHENEFIVHVDSAAYDKMYEHFRFLARVSVSAAERLYLAYEEALCFLGQSPEICPRYIVQKKTDADLRYKLLAKRYRIVFEIIGNTVYVYDIQDCRQDADKSLVD
jgi:hypothetical protein